MQDLEGNLQRKSFEIQPDRSGAGFDTVKNVKVGSGVENGTLTGSRTCLEAPSRREFLRDVSPGRPIYRLWRLLTALPLAVTPSACTPLHWPPCTEAPRVDGTVAVTLLRRASPRARLAYALADDESPIELTVTTRTWDHRDGGKSFERFFALELRRRSAHCYRVELEDQDLVQGARSARAACSRSRPRGGEARAWIRRLETRPTSRYPTRSQPC